MADTSTLDIDPKFLPAVNEWLERCATEIVDGTVHITETWRTPAAQNMAAASGASKAKAGQSPHNWTNAAGEPSSRAIDYAILALDGSYVKDGTDARYTQANAIAMSIKDADGNRLIKCGAEWTLKTDGCEPDFDHLQMWNWKTA